MGEQGEKGRRGEGEKGRRETGGRQETGDRSPAAICLLAKIA